jgi:hypothetical protein
MDLSARLWASPVSVEEQSAYSIPNTGVLCKKGAHPDHVPLIPKVREGASDEPEKYKGRYACRDSQCDFGLLLEVVIR